jgi:hypothetical protein
VRLIFSRVAMGQRQVLPQEAWPQASSVNVIQFVLLLDWNLATHDQRIHSLGRSGLPVNSSDNVHCWRMLPSGQWVNRSAKLNGSCIGCKLLKLDNLSCRRVISSGPERFGDAAFKG